MRGAPSALLIRRLKMWDHPRMCGEHHRVRRCPFPQEGSSPHVRGALSLTLSARMLVGIIPACAGSTRTSCNLWGCHRDHPRMCGEHRNRRSGTPTAAGSSPHVRGARCGRETCRSRPGIIPACAGSTRSWTCPIPRTRDHPRMCGEHALLMTRATSRPGSSPHVRGALRDRVHRRRHAGIIPACAGSTWYFN